ncbi:MAG: HipA N-terminal domain-containing protein [Muribaculaceae bacterium]|nr:HipA N-terminal domain-containing protein [Muribaculaceae bacterium]
MAQRQAEVYFKDRLAGLLSETDSGYTFEYLPEYLGGENPHPVSLTLPLSEEAYTSSVLFPFFDGLIPEGWLLDVAIRNSDVSILDRMALLMLCCKDCIGAVSVIERKEASDV